MPLANAIDAVPIVPDGTTRDVLFPIGTRAQNQRVQNLTTGVFERWSGSAWVVDVESTVAALPAESRTILTMAAFLANNTRRNVLDYAAGASITDGTTDASAAILATDAQAAAHGRGVQFAPGTYAVASSLAINAPIDFMPGALLKPASGVVITINGALPLLPCHYFDLSAGGTIAFGPAVSIVCPEWWGAVADSAGTTGSGTDSTVPLNAMLAAADAARGLRVRLARGIYRTTAELTPKKRTTIEGAGMLSSLIFCDHDGDGLRGTWGLNSSQEASTHYRHFGLFCLSATNTGGGIVDESGAYVTLDHVYVESFQDNVILDQTEHGAVEYCRFERLKSNCRSGVWLVNGNDRRSGADKRFTNRITIRANQFNATAGQGISIRDDGGINHTIADNNIAAGDTGVSIANVSGLTLTGNECEGNTTIPVQSARVTSLGAVDVGESDGVTIRGNTFSDHTGYHIDASYLRAGEITANTHANYTTAAVHSTTSFSVGLRIGQNSKSVSIAAAQPSGPYLSASSDIALGIRYEQDIETHVSATLTAGSDVVVTPNTMGSGFGPEQIIDSKQLFAVNADGTNGEIITVSAVTGTTFTADFASNKAANWCLHGLTNTP